MKHLTHGSTFSGIGAAEIAAEMLGIENLFHCEINPFGRQVLEYYFPNEESYEDITKTDFTKWGGQVDILTGGFPCQPFSYAGKRKGADDDRYLWPFMLQCIQQIRPTWFVGENVAGITTMVLPSEDATVESEATLFGEDNHIETRAERFVIEEICNNLEKEGYSVQPIVIPACAVGAPHRRDRVFFIAKRDDSRNARNTDCIEHNEREEQKMARRDEVPNTSRVCKQGSEGRISKPHTDTNGSSGSKAQSDNVKDTLCNGCLQRDTQEQGGERNIRDIGTGDSERICGEERSVLRTDTNPDNSIISRRVNNGTSSETWRDTSRELTKICGETNVSESQCDATDTNGTRQPTPECESGRERQTMDGECECNPFDGTERYLLPENRWRAFPTQSPVYRGNDGLPFDVDDLTIPFGKWKAESLKAYGNAIVVQVMYEIFRAIQQVENNTTNG